ncbi:hypothetical protein CR513_27880, partial [Mucuna pruriens]
ASPSATKPYHTILNSPNTVTSTPIQSFNFTIIIIKQQRNPLFSHPLYPFTSNLFALLHLNFNQIGTPQSESPDPSIRYGAPFNTQLLECNTLSSNALNLCITNGSNPTKSQPLQIPAI